MQFFCDVTGGSSGDGIDLDDDNKKKEKERDEEDIDSLVTTELIWTMTTQ